MFQQLNDGSTRRDSSVSVEVVTAISLEKSEQQKLKQRLAGVVAQPVLLNLKVDSSLIGGIILKIGDRVIDGSTRGRLSALREELQYGKPASKQTEKSGPDSHGMGNGIEVVTVVPLNEAEKTKLTERLTDLLGHPISFKQRIDPTLIGGTVIRIGDKTIDGSLRRELTERTGELVRRKHE